jgi:hypothetical protein
MLLSGSLLAIAYYKIEGGRLVLLHSEVPQELPGLGYGSRRAHGVFEALRQDENSDREVALHVLLRPAP